MLPAKSTPAIAQVRSQERDANVTQLENQMASLMEKMNHYENLEEQMTQLMQLVQNQQNHSLEASQVLNFNVSKMYWFLNFLSIATIILLLKLISL